MRGEDFLPLLEGVKQTSENTYFARCPAHADRTASLSIRIEKDRTLFKCFGCGANGTQVMEALKLSITDLFVNGNGHAVKLTLDSFAKVKQLPRQFLIDNDVGEGDGTLTFHHMLTDGRRAQRHHIRKFLSGKGEGKFVWGGAKGGKFVPYGLWHLSRWRKEGITDLHLVEGECLPGDAEVFTTTGWRRFDQYDGQEPIAEWDSGRLEFVQPLRIVKRDFDGELCGLRGLGYQATVTPNHKLPVWQSGSLRGYQADSLPSVGHMPRCGGLDGDGLPLSDDEIALTLAISADASIHERKTMGNYCFVHLKKARKIERLCGLLDRLQIPYECTVPSPTVKTGPHKGQACQRVEPDWRYIKFNLPRDWTWAGRMLPKEWLVQASYQQREVILAEMVHWDGNSVPNRNQHEYSSKHYENAVWMQTIAHTAGRCSTIIPRKNELGEWFKVSILHGKTYTSLPSLKKTRERYVGKVYCVTVPSGYFLVRQHGYISITGNSDALTLWLHGKAALGLPGAQTTDTLQAPHIAGFNRVWVVREPGEGGDQFTARMQGRLAVLRCRATVKIMRCGRYKDTSDLHCDGPEYFESRWIECQTAAETVELEVAGFVLRKLSDIEEEKVEWLWPGRLPLAKLSLFAGDGGLGKSLVSQDIAAKLSRGAVWPDGRRGYPAGSTLILSSEDDAADTLKPRLRVAGADLDRIIIPEGLRMQSADGLLQDRSFNVRTDLGELEQALESVPDVRLVILDPISGFMGATDGHKNTDVRGTLAPLCKIAQKYRCAILMLTHMNKGQGTPLHRIIDSVAFGAICRMAYAFAEDPENEGRVIFAPVKNNLGKRDSALSYAVEENHEGIAKVVWGSEAAINMTTVMAQNSAAALGRPPDKIKAAIELIQELLEDGPVWAKYVHDRAAKEDIGRNTMLKAKDALGVSVYKDDGRWMWAAKGE